MFQLSLKSLWGRRRRVIGTSIAIFIGVAFLVGTLALGDTLSANFNRLFTEVTAGTDVVVRSTTAIDQVRGPARRSPIDQSLVDAVRGVDGVAAAEPSISGYGTLLGRDGDPIGGNGPPRLAGNWIEDTALNPYRLVEGRAPRTNDEVVINRGAAKDGHLAVGDTTIVQTPEPVTVKVVGIATFGGSDGFGRVTFTAFTLAGAQEHVMKRLGQVTTILVRGDAGLSEQEVEQRVRAVTPPNVETITGHQLTKETIDDINATFLNLLRTFLVAFAAVALLVATFSIHNTFSIILAQRTREIAMIRAIGATRRQVLTSLGIESLGVGAIASTLGIVGGVGIAGLLKGMFDAFGFNLPAGGLDLRPRAMVIGLVVGVVVTLLAAITPTLRAMNVAPLAALRESAAESARTSRLRLAFGAITVAIGAVVLVWAARSSNAVALAAIGALAVLVGVVALGPLAARPASLVIGAPLAALRGIPGALARDNAGRNPRRTASTATALLIGVTVVSLFMSFASSIKASVDADITKSFGADLVVNSPSFGGSAFSPQLAEELARLPEVRDAVGVGQGSALVNGRAKQVTVADAARLADVIDFTMIDGSLRDIGTDGLAISQSKATDEGWRLGSVVPVTFIDATTSQFTVRAIYDANSMVGNVIVPRVAWTPHALQDTDVRVLVALKSGVDPVQARAAITPIADRYGSADVQDRGQYAASVTSGLNLLLGIVYVMLALAIVIALMGIANTLALSIYERRHELGLLRAVGQTRSQARSTVRLESVIIAVFGTIGGAALGVVLGWGLVGAASGELTTKFALPVGQLAVVVVLGALAGLLAALRPARHAARLAILDAIGAG